MNRILLDPQEQSRLNYYLTMFKDLKQARQVSETARKLIDLGDADAALRLIESITAVSSPSQTNLVSVCYLRLNQPEKVIQLLESEVLTSYLFIRPEASPAMKINYATALLMTSDISGCLGVLDAIKCEAEPVVMQLREAIRRFQRSNQIEFDGKIGFVPGLFDDQLNVFATTA